jgi:hypothetical protein
MLQNFDIIKQNHFIPAKFVDMAMALTSVSHVSSAKENVQVNHYHMTQLHPFI